jgi:inhibitor of KinA
LKPMTTAGIDFPLTVTPLAESALLVRVGDGEQIDPDVVDAVTALTHAIDRNEIPGIIEVVPAYTTILVEFDAVETDGDRVEAAVRRIAAGGLSGPDREPRTVIIPVVYGGEFGPDLLEVATTLGLSPEDVVTLHSGAEYRVACMGFSPGWAYLMGMPQELTTPRRKDPRTRIPPGSVAIGGAQTGVYPSATPGGWHLLGRTPLAMFDPDRDEPFLLQPGDHVHFAPIDEARYLAIERQLDEPND